MRLCLPVTPQFPLYHLYCLSPGKSRAGWVQIQLGHHGVLLKSHYISPHHLRAQLAVKPFICTSTTGIWSKVLWSTHMWLNSAWLCSKLQFSKSYFSVISHSAGCEWLTSLPLCPLSPPLLLRLSLPLSLQHLAQAGKSSTPTVPLSDSVVCLADSQPVFSAPLNLITTSL